MTPIGEKETEFYRARALYYLSEKPVPELVPEWPVALEPEPEATSQPWIDEDWIVGPRKIKMIARGRILTILPDWKQANMTARSVELTRARMAGALTAGEQAEEAAIQAAWDWVKAVRAYSDTLEAAYQAAEDKAGFDYLTGWPEFGGASMQVGQLEEPEEIEIPRFLAPDPLESVPASLLDLVEPDETAEQMQARLWSLWLELNGKLMLGLATPEETALHSRLHNELHWFAPPVEGE